MRLSRFVVLATSLILLSFLSADADDVSGKIKLRGGGLKIDTGQTPAYWSVWNGALPFNPMNHRPQDHLVVVLEGGAGKATNCRFELRNASVHPTTIVASAGKATTLTNRDGFAYELYSLGGEQIPPTLLQPTNKIDLPALSNPGEKLALRDTLHPHISGTLVAVSKLAACATIKEDGSYEFEDVPDGSYTLHAYWDGRELSKQKIEMDGDDVDVKQIKGNITRVAQGGMQ